jgi:uncharacterized protein YjiS (DUF1127 family)
MTVIDSGLRFDARPRLTFLSAFKWRLLRLLVRLRRHNRAAQTHIMLSRLDSRLLYDIGLEPLDLHAVLKRRQPPPMLMDAMRKQFDYRNRDRLD